MSDQERPEPGTNEQPNKTSRRTFMVGGAAAAIGAAAGSRIGAGHPGVTDDQARLLDIAQAGA